MATSRRPVGAPADLSEEADDIVTSSTRSPATLGHVLIVDDDLLVRETMRDYIEHLGYAVRDVGSAAEALIEIAKEAPDLVLLDVRMPGITGIDLCRQLRCHTLIGIEAKDPVILGRVHAKLLLRRKPRPRIYNQPCPQLLSELPRPIRAL